VAESGQGDMLAVLIYSKSYHVKDYIIFFFLLFFISSEDRKSTGNSSSIKEKNCLSDPFQGDTDCLHCSGGTQVEQPSQPGIGHFAETSHSKGAG